MRTSRTSGYSNHGTNSTRCKRVCNTLSAILIGGIIGCLIAVIIVFSMYLVASYEANGFPQAGAEQEQIASAYSGSYSDHYRDSLNENEKKVYDELESGFRSLRTPIKVESGTSTDDVSRIWSFVIYDNPDLFWVDPVYRVNHSWGDSIVSVNVSYRYDVDNVRSMLSDYDNEVDNVIDKLHLKGKRDDDAMKLIVSWVCNKCSYDTDGDAEGSGQCIDSAFNGNTVCAGYSRLVQLIAEADGIDCGYVSGTVQGGAHAWNVIESAEWNNGGNVYYDATWADPGNTGEMKMQYVGVDYHAGEIDYPHVWGE